MVIKQKCIGLLCSTLAYGGAERVASLLSKEFSKIYTTYVILLRNEKTYESGGTLIYLSGSRSRNPLVKIFQLIKYFFKIRRIVKKKRISLLISFMEGPNILNLIANPVKKILTVHTILSTSLRVNPFFTRSLYTILIKLFYNRADKIIAVSSQVKQDLIKNFNIEPNKIDVIPNPINLKNIKNLAKEKIEKKYQKIFRYPVLINVGNLRIAKGQWHLVRAFKDVKKDFPNVKLVIIGGGPQAHLNSLIKLLDLRNDVFLLGWHKNPFKFLSRSTIFVFPSLWEGMPLTVLEAMACGCSIVASKIFKEIVGKNKCGLTVPATDIKFYTNEPLTREEKILARAIIKLLKNNKLRKKFALNAKKRAKDFDVKIIAKKYFKLISLIDKAVL